MKKQICDSSAADLAKRTAKIIISSDATAKNLVSKKFNVVCQLSGLVPVFSVSD